MVEDEEVSTGCRTSPRMELVKPAEPASVPELRRRAARFAAEQGLNREGVADVALAVSEAVTNAVKYANTRGGEGVVELSASRKKEWIELRVRDRGEAFGRGSADGLGLGLTIIARLSAELKIIQEGDGTEVRMRFRVATD
jgi:anti-sigma regulatory factor (Ser/Thr protein kinase)